MFSLCVDLLALTDNVDHNRACKNAAGKDIRPVVGQADHIDDVVDDKHNENTQAYADRVADTAGQARARPTTQAATALNSQLVPVDGCALLISIVAITPAAADRTPEIR